ncbi:GL12802 [Drosophila persimilis]|uniref:GL12802 n=1 Tax=Drosophila persimilis TaxID=7234 RepID=B4H7P9_DROPE|nr:GL12802 [Drosophila persimilis]
MILCPSLSFQVWCLVVCLSGLVWCFDVDCLPQQKQKQPAAATTAIASPNLESQSEYDSKSESEAAFECP